MIGIAIVALLLGAVAYGELVTNRRCRATIEQWAHDNGVSVGSVRRLWLWAKAWGLRTEGRNGRFFNVTVIEPAGAVRRAQAKVYGGFGGYGASEIQVRWLDYPSR